MFSTVKGVRAIGVAASLLLSVTSSGCSDLQSRVESAEQIARQAGLTPKVIEGGAFRLMSYSRLRDPQAAVHIYIEGDGFAWVTRTQRSADPTPYNPVALKLAAEDSSANVVYLARPCQYLGVESEPRCTQESWSGARFSEQVIAATNRALDRLVGKQQKIELIGYSGGAAVALLVAARRSDVTSVRTVAGMLDHEMFSRIHQVSPLSGSLNPRDVATQLAALPQRHYLGSEDEVITTAMARDYLDALGDSRCTTLITIEGASHATGWEQRWSGLLAQQPACQDK